MQNWLQKPEGLPSSENTRVLPRTQNKHPRQKFCPNKKNESKGTAARCTLATQQEHPPPRGARELTGGEGN
jgi:hypothetical protein